MSNSAPNKGGLNIVMVLGSVRVDRQCDRVAKYVQNALNARNHHVVILGKHSRIKLYLTKTHTIVSDYYYKIYKQQSTQTKKEYGLLAVDCLIDIIYQFQIALWHKVRFKDLNWPFDPLPCLNSIHFHVLIRSTSMPQFDPLPCLNSIHFHVSIRSTSMPQFDPFPCLNSIHFYASIRSISMSWVINNCIVVIDPKDHNLGQVIQPIHFYKSPADVPKEMAAVHQHIVDADAFVVVAAGKSFFNTYITWFILQTFKKLTRGEIKNTQRLSVYYTSNSLSWLVKIECKLHPYTSTQSSSSVLPFPRILYPVSQLH